MISNNIYSSNQPPFVVNSWSKQPLSQWFPTRVKFRTFWWQTDVLAKDYKYSIYVCMEAEHRDYGYQFNALDCI